MSARIYQPSKTAMQSGRAKTHYWILEFTSDTPKERDPLMGWISSKDTKHQVMLKFPTLEDAQRYADDHKISYTVVPAHNPKLTIHPYSERFTRKP